MTSEKPENGSTPGDSKAADGDPKEPEQALAPMDFSTFILSLGSSAMVNLGRLPAPGTEERIKDLPAAKQIIDIIGLLEEKTRGNLDDSETKLLRSLLYDLRVQYVDAQNE